MNYKVRCESKGSLTFVIDTTGSMHDDIAETVKASKKVLKMAIENNSSVIENFVLISFNDPGTFKFSILICLRIRDRLVRSRTF